MVVDTLGKHVGKGPIEIKIIDPKKQRKKNAFIKVKV
jgi:hypothetical protein